MSAMSFSVQNRRNRRVGGPLLRSLSLLALGLVHDRCQELHLVSTHSPISHLPSIFLQPLTPNHQTHLLLIPRRRTRRQNPIPNTTRRQMIQNRMIRQIQHTAIILHRRRTIQHRLIQKHRQRGRMRKALAGGRHHVRSVETA